MRGHSIHRYGLLILLAATGLACSLVSNIGQGARDVQATLEAEADRLKDKGRLLVTARPLLTQAEGLGVVETAQALASQSPGLLETAQAFATQQGPQMLETLQAAGTPGIGALETMQALATEKGPSLAATLQAQATRLAPGNLPADIPVPSPSEGIYGSQELVTFSTSLELRRVADFYRLEMPRLGWEAAGKGWFETNDVAIQVYLKDRRKATLTIGINPLNDATKVVIFITSE